MNASQKENRHHNTAETFRGAGAPVARLRGL